MSQIEFNDDFIKFVKGVIGEEDIVYLIKKNIDIYYKLVQNVFIYDENNNKTEIDIILIMSTGIYVIESKNYNGKINGEEDNEYWIQYFKENDNYVPFKSPIIQNEYHINKLYKKLNKDKSIFKSYIIFGRNTDIKKVKEKLPNLQVININEFLYNLKQDIHNSDICLSNEEIDKIYFDLQHFNEHSR